MIRITKLQAIGPAVLFSVVAAAEASAYALAQSPSSPWLWYLNLEVFGLLRKSEVLLSGYVDQPFAQLWLVGCLMLFACVGLLARNRLLIALSSNLSLVYACFTIYSWHSLGPSAKAVSLATVPMPSGTDLFLLCILGFASALSAAVSHLLYVRELRYGNEWN
jgi:hypothetical protein